MKPRVSVLMTVYNGEKFIKETIRSVLNQTYQDFEFIIVDDGSTDKTKEIIKSFPNEQIKYFYKGTNKGYFELHKAVNFGLDKCQGDYIARIDADDLWARDKLNKQVRYLDKHKDIFMIGTSALIIDEYGHTIREIKKRNYPSFLYKYRLASSNSFIHSSIMFRNDGIRYPSFNEHMFYVLMVFFKRKVKNIPNFLVKYRINPNGMVAQHGGKYE